MDENKFEPDINEVPVQPIDEEVVEAEKAEEIIVEDAVKISDDNNADSTNTDTTTDNTYNQGYYNSQYQNYNQGYYNNQYQNYNQNFTGNNNQKPKKKIWPIVVAIVAVVCVVGFLGLTGLAVLGYSLIPANNNTVLEEDGIVSEILGEDESVEDEKTDSEPIGVVEADGTGISTGGYDVSGIVDAVMPCVVSISSTTSVKGYSMFGQQYEQDVASSGTGFIVGQNDTELLLATNNHVVEDATAIQVTFADEATAEAIVKGTDANADLAVIAVSLKDIKQETKDAIKVSVLGDSDAVKVGQMAIAIGNAQGMGQSVTVGYISAKERQLDMDDPVTGGKRTMTFLQTDAAINGGNSGGPLLDVNGNVVGINSAKISDTQVEGMCYAIPISTAIPIINELMNRETLTEEERGYLGISLQNISSEAVEMYGVPDGVYVANVSNDSPADKAGLIKGDIITEINGVAVNTSSAASDKVNSYRAGTEITIKVYRQNASKNGYEPMEIKAKLATAEEIGISNQPQEEMQEENNNDNEEGYDSYEDYYDNYGNGSIEDYFDSMFPW